MRARRQAPLRKGDVQQLLPPTRQEQETMEMWALKTIRSWNVPELLH